MFWKKISTLIIPAALVLASACSLQVGQPSGDGSGPQATSAIQTQVAGIVASTLTAQANLVQGETATRAALATSTPEFTFTPSLFPTQTFTLTPTVPMISVSVNTNCRTGPNTGYERLGTLAVGEQAEVVGRTPLSDSLIIKLPSTPPITCWLWTKYATLTGDISGLPVFPIPPTPTPRLTETPQNGFTLTYVSTDTCGGDYYIKFQIANTGGLTWESDLVKVTDKNTSVLVKISRDNFPYYSSTCDENADQNLEPGEVGFTTSGAFTTNPHGHAMSATITLCSKNGLDGTCLEQTITFTP
jgi:hypothetical protein